MAHYASKLKSGGTQGYGSDRDRRSWSNLVGHFLTCDTRSHEYLSRMIRCSATGTLPGRALGVGRPRGRDFNATSGIAISGLCRNSTNRKRRQIPLDAQSSAGYQSTKCYTIVMMLYIQGTSSPSLVAERPPHLLATSVLMLARSGAAGYRPHQTGRAFFYLPTPPHIMHASTREVLDIGNREPPPLSPMSGRAFFRCRSGRTPENGLSAASLMQTEEWCCPARTRSASLPALD